MKFSSCATATVLITAALQAIALAALAPSNTVSIYTEPNYSGTELLFTPEQAQQMTLKAAYRNQISSLKVPRGYRVSLVDTDNGRQYKHFEAGDYAFVGAQMNNKADAVIVSLLR